MTAYMVSSGVACLIVEQAGDWSPSLCNVHDYFKMFLKFPCLKIGENVQNTFIISG